MCWFAVRFFFYFIVDVVVDVDVEVEEGVVAGLAYKKRENGMFRMHARIHNCKKLVADC